MDFWKKPIQDGIRQATLVIALVIVATPLLLFICAGIKFNDCVNIMAATNIPWIVFLPFTIVLAAAGLVLAIVFGYHATVAREIENNKVKYHFCGILALVAVIVPGIWMASASFGSEIRHAFQNDVAAISALYPTEAQKLSTRFYASKDAREIRRILNAVAELKETLPFP